MTNNPLQTMVALGWLEPADGRDLDTALQALCRLGERGMLSRELFEKMLEALAQDVADNVIDRRVALARAPVC